MNRTSMTLVSVAVGALLMAAPRPSINGAFFGFAQAFAKRGNGHGTISGPSLIEPYAEQGEITGSLAPFAKTPAQPIAEAEAAIKQADEDFANSLIDRFMHDTIVAEAQGEIEAARASADGGDAK